MAWGPETQQLVSQMCDRGESSSAIVAEVCRRHGVNDKTVRRWVVGLDLINQKDSVHEAVRERFERLGGTDHYLENLRRQYGAHNNQMERLPNLHQEDLMREARRLHQLAEGLQDVSLEPLGGIGAELYQALREHTHDLGLPTLLEDHSDALKEYRKARNLVGMHLENHLQTILPRLPDGVPIHPWNQHLMGVLEEGARTGQPIERRKWSHDSQEDHLDLFRPDWGGYSPTQWPVSSKQFRVIAKLHDEFRTFAAALAGDIGKPYQRLGQLTQELVDMLAELIIKSRANGRIEGHCRYCQ